MNLVVVKGIIDVTIREAGKSGEDVADATELLLTSLVKIVSATVLLGISNRETEAAKELPGTIVKEFETRVRRFVIHACRECDLPDIFSEPTHNEKLVAELKKEMQNG